MTIGIYEIVNLINNKKYGGQSQNVERRIKEHKAALRNNRHGNKHLQSSFNKYGEEAFEFKLVKACKKRYLDRFEKLYIHLNKTMDRDYGYNLESGGHENKKCSQETIEKLSGENNHGWKDYPRIIQAGTDKNGKQRYAIRVEGKEICHSTDLKLLEEKLDNNDFTLIYNSPVIGDAPHIIKNGFRNGKQQYAIRVEGKEICRSTDLILLKEKLENNDFTPIHNSPVINGEAHIIKQGFNKNGKQQYALVKDGKILCRSVNLEKLKEKLELIKNNQLKEIK